MKFYPRGTDPHSRNTRLKTRMVLLWFAIIGGAVILLMAWLGILSLISSAKG